MIYIDTDVLVHAYVIQDRQKHNEARELLERIVANDSPVISTLSVQETLFVLDRIGIDKNRMDAAYSALMQMQPIAYQAETLRRAVNIARRVGFRNINDCIHTAIAESHCSELITYNRQDFSRIRQFASIPITIL